MWIRRNDRISDKCCILQSSLETKLSLELPFILIRDSNKLSVKKLSVKFQNYNLVPFSRINIRICVIDFFSKWKKVEIWQKRMVKRCADLDRKNILCSLFPHYSSLLVSYMWLLSLAGCICLFSCLSCFRLRYELWFCKKFKFSFLTVFASI